MLARRRTRDETLALSYKKIDFGNQQKSCNFAKSIMGYVDTIKVD